MGKTILAHALFSCGHIELDLDNFFSDTGNAHAIQKINNTNLVAEHLVEFPDDSLKCIAQVVCQDWWTLLQIKFLYSKWLKTTPALDNFSIFCADQINVEKEQQRLWQQFYSAFKDISWPECTSPGDIINLPVRVQQEINQAFYMPEIFVPQTEQQLVEHLAITYYDILCKSAKTTPHSKVILLGDYIQGNLTSLIDICTSVMHWTWDHNRSQQFYNKMLLVNQKYLDWLDHIKQALTLRSTYDLAPWEQALAIAKWCVDKNQHPNNLNWDSVGCNTDINHLYLDILLRKHHGKTI